MCTIADAKVQLNYNCYNMYFYDCLPETPSMIVKNTIIPKTAKVSGIIVFAER